MFGVMAKAYSRRLGLVTGRPTGMVRVVGLEPTHTCVREILSLVRLPFRHTRAWPFWHGNTVPSTVRVATRSYPYLS
jgi:hypothetical protein